jgi:type II secretory pathway component PulJ
MELLISVFLISLISLFMISAIGTTKQTNSRLVSHHKADVERDKVFSLIYQDIMQSYEINISQTQDRRFQTLSMQTSNSLYDIAAPYVVYFVNSQTNVLTRLESAINISLPVRYEEEHLIYADAIVKEVDDFNLYRSNKKTDDLNITDTNSSDTNTAKAKLHEHLIYLNSRIWPKPMLFVLKL